MNESWKSFIIQSLSVILGIFITFTIQGMIDRSHDRKEVKSALWLVRTELTTNLEDISTMTEFLKQERASAQYFVNHSQDIDTCPSDSIDYHSGIILADVSVKLDGE